MLIALSILYLTYFPWPSAGALWTKSLKKNPGRDELHEFVRPGDERKSMSPLLGARWPTHLFPTAPTVAQAEFEGIFPDHGKRWFSAPEL